MPIGIHVAEHHTVQWRTSALVNLDCCVRRKASPNNRDLSSLRIESMIGIHGHGGSFGLSHGYRCTSSDKENSEKFFHISTLFVLVGMRGNEGKIRKRRNSALISTRVSLMCRTGCASR